MRKCKHKTFHRMRRFAGVWGRACDCDDHMGTEDARWCARCGEWLSIGPSRDTDRTAIEVRAAELVAAGFRSGSWAYLDETHCNHWYDNDGPCCRCGYDGDRETVCEAGYLARVIVEHNDGGTP